VKRVLFGGKGQEPSEEEGVFVKISKDRLEELTKDAKQLSLKEGKRSRLGPFNLRELQPCYSNEYGQFTEASPREFRSLSDLAVSITLTQLNKVP